MLNPEQEQYKALLATIKQHIFRKGSEKQDYEVTSK